MGARGTAVFGPREWWQEFFPYQTLLPLLPTRNSFEKLLSAGGQSRQTTDGGRLRDHTQLRPPRGQRRLADVANSDYGSSEDRQAAD